MKKKTIHVIASEAVFESAKQALPAIVRERMDNYEFRRIEPAASPFDTYSITLNGDYEDNFLIKLASDFHAVQTHIETFSCESAFANSSISDQEEYLRSVNANQIFADSFRKIRAIVGLENECIDMFMRAHARRKEDSMVPFFLRKSRITKESTLKQILEDALHKPMHKSSSDAMQVAIELQWLDDTGGETNDTPEPVKKVLRKIQSEAARSKNSMSN